jgi:diaminopimelate decarboxylase
MLYGARHPVTLLATGADLPPRDTPWTLSGPICEAGDVLAGDVDLGPQAGVGALLAIGEAGAYGAAMASNYNGRLRPAQVVINGGELELSRRRETLEDLLARDA